MACQCQPELFGRDAATVIDDGDALDTTVFKPDLDLGGAGIDCVLEQFLDDGGRSFDDFAGRDLGNQCTVSSCIDELPDERDDRFVQYRLS